ncbi:MAG: ABC transporter ATP-binding protein [Myxococcota bacterium]
MEHSTLGSPALLAAMDLVARIAAPVSLFMLASGHPGASVGAALIVGGLGVVRGLLAGYRREHEARTAWRNLVGLVAKSRIEDLTRRTDDEHAWRLIEAIQRQVELRATTGPRLAADAIALGLTAIAVAVLLGPLWVLLGAAGFAVIALLVVPAQRRIRRAEEQSWQELTEVGTELDVLLEGAAELRAYGRAPAVADALLSAAGRAAAAQRRGLAASAGVGLLPLAIILLSVTVPSWTGFDLHDTAAAAPIGILGGSGFLFAMGLVRGFESYASSAPQRAMLARLVAKLRRGAEGGTRTEPSETEQARAPAGDPPIASGALEVCDVSVVHEGASAATPAPVSFRWPPRSGIAIYGPNGAGKTTLLLTLLGLVPPSSGEFRLSRSTTSGRVAPCFGPGGGVVFLPQTPYVARERTVRWHLELLGGDRCAEPDFRRALENAGLWGVLARHRETTSPLEVPAGELSGGERRRLFLARLFLVPPSRTTFFILDEPEAALDASGRRWLRATLAELARTSRVAVVAHDPSVIPEDFLEVHCRSGPSGARPDRARGARIE